MPAKNTVCELEILDLNNLGFGVGRVDGKVVFVSGAVDGDRVMARIVRDCAGYAIARTEQVLSPSPHRTAPLCTMVGCGGCAYRQVHAAHEAALKEAHVREAFHKQGLSDVTVLPLLTTGERYHYRNKAQYPVAAEKDGGLRIGFYAPKSHRVVAAEDCPLQDAAFAPILHQLHALLVRYGILSYQEETHTGLLRHIYLRTGRESGEVLLTLVINGKTLPHAKEIVSAMTAAFPALVGILLNHNEARTNVICGDRYTTLYGRDYMLDRLCGLELKIAPAAFYQVNHAAAELLYRRARELAELRGDELLLDLFCGTGSIGLSMADGVREVIGIEIVAEAVACAKENAARNGIYNASFYCGDATHTENLLAMAQATRGAAICPDVVVLDPPRKGCGTELLSYIADLAPSRIVYISCNPDTLARDATHLLSAGYTLSPVAPVDLFPCTGHVECVCRFTREGC